MRTGISITVSASDRRRLQAVVRDRNAAQKHAWRAEIVVLSADGVQQVPFHAIYNSDGPHHLELVQAVKGTLWTVPGAGHAHHMGYWAKDVGAASRYLESKGLPRVAAIGARSESDTGRAVYHQGRAGVYIELVDPAGAEYIFGPA